MADQKNPLPTDMEGSYNGYTFSQYAETTAFQIKPAFDSAGRTTIYNEYTITITDLVGDFDPNIRSDDTVEDAIVRLSAQGGEFNYVSHGLGNITIQDGMQDVRYGPKVTAIAWKPHGNIGARVTWTVQLCLTECNNSNNQRGVLEYCWKLTTDIDLGGYTKRTYAGHVRIAGYRATQATRTLSDQADRLREEIDRAFAVPERFRRANRHFELSEDKTRLDFTLTDEELPGAVPPPGVVLVQSNHYVQTVGRGLFNWVGTIEATYEIARDRLRTDAYAHFKALCEDRLKQCKQFSVSKKDSNDRPQTVVLPLRFRMGEPQLYDRSTANFSFQYSYTTSLKNAIKSSALWKLPPGGDAYGPWKASLFGVNGPRGIAGLATQLSDEVIVDFCAQQAATTRPGGSVVQRLSDPPLDPTLERIFQVDPPPPAERSWIMYEIGITVEERPGTVELKVLPQSPPTEDTLGKPIVRPGGYTDPFRGVKPSVNQIRAKPNTIIWLWGRALRAGYGIPCPQLKSAGGVEAIPADEPGNYFHHWIAAECGVAVVAAKWRVAYYLPDVPTEIGLPANPLMADTLDSAEGTVPTTTGGFGTLTAFPFGR